MMVTASTEWTAEEIEDLIGDAITDSMDMDWTARDGAKSIMRELAANGLHITYTDARRDLLANPPTEPTAEQRRAVWQRDLEEDDMAGGPYG